MKKLTPTDEIVFKTLMQQSFEDIFSAILNSHPEYGQENPLLVPEMSNKIRMFCESINTDPCLTTLGCMNLAIALLCANSHVETEQPAQA